MISNFTITDTELEAIRSVERYAAAKLHEGGLHPPQPFAGDIETLNRLLERLTPAPPVEEVASSSNGEPTQPAAGSPIGIVRDRPSHNEPEDLRGPSVVDRGSREIETRWAKEAIGLTAVELNEAYAQFEITSDGCSIPSGPLHRASERLAEVMQRLGITGEIPF